MTEFAQTVLRRLRKKVATQHPCLCVIEAGLVKNQQPGRVERVKQSANQIWYTLCHHASAMRTVCRGGARRGRVKFVLGALLALGIVTVLLLPSAGQVRRFGSGARNLFMLTEGDYLSPLISSAKTVTILNCAAQKVGQFAGYDDFRTRIDISNEPHIANITRYNGNLLSLLGIHFERIEPATATEPSIYISESFWNEAFGRSENILGTLLKLHATNYRVCGVTRGTSALVPQTDIWLPVSGRGACGAMACMRIVGALEPRTDWRTAQRELLSCFEKFLQDQPYNGISGTRMLPMEPGIYFRDYLPMVAASSHRWRQRAWSRT
jgi:hypothetical protein